MQKSDLLFYFGYFILLHFLFGKYILNNYAFEDKYVLLGFGVHNCNLIIFALAVCNVDMFWCRCFNHFVFVWIHFAQTLPLQETCSFGFSLPFTRPPSPPPPMCFRV
jgi:hypothetical protein